VTPWFLFNELNDAIIALNTPTAGLYAERAFTLSVDQVYQTYSIPEANQDMLGILGIRVLDPSTADVYFNLPPRAYDWQQSKNLIRITRGLPGSSSIEVRYRAPFVKAATLDDDVNEDCGLAASMNDIPPLAAAAAYLRTTEARRGQVQVQGDARRAAEVQGGQSVTTAREMERRLKTRIDGEYSRLLQRNSIRQDI